jgi:hypothetical protein
LLAVLVSAAIPHGFGGPLDVLAANTGPVGFKKPLIHHQGQFLKPNKQVAGVFIA